ncbi:MAG: hypothetical protein HY299_20970 [Verrucomicrobia bacterium]|nr:hypothetical protein [Verrucomicrobiota bacterium]
MADALLHADATNDLLPSVRGLVNCPVLREIHGELQVAGPGYDEETGLIVTGGVTPAIVPVDCANDQFMRRK